MAQYDLHLYQNSAESGVEFTEKVVAFGPAGSLLVSGAAGAITVLTPQEADAGKFIKVNATYDGYEFAVVEASLTDPLVYKGVLNCSGNPPYPAADAGHVYIVGAAGKIGGSGGLNVEVGDMLICTTDSTVEGDESTVGAYWNIVQANIDGAVRGPASATDGHMVVFDQATGKLIKAHASGAPGTMAFETATNYVAKALFDANTILFATDDNTPAALAGKDIPTKFWAAVPADKIGTGYSGNAVAGQMAKDDNYIYICETGGAAESQEWSRLAKATNWTNPA